MRLLLDTHVWAWSLLDPDRLVDPVKSAFSDSETELWLSSISVWELTLLIERGRIDVDRPAVEWVREALERVPLREALCSHAVALHSRSLPLSHADPADRFLVATADIYDLTLVTADERLIESEACDILQNR